MSRNTFSSQSPAPVSGADFLDQYSAHIAALYRAGIWPLTNVAGTSDLTANLEPAIGEAGLVDGMHFAITWPNTNTGPLSLSINDSAPVPVVFASGQELVAGALRAGMRSMIEYIGGAFVLSTDQSVEQNQGSLGVTTIVSQTFVSILGIPAEANHVSIILSVKAATIDQQPTLRLMTAAGIVSAGYAGFARSMGGGLAGHPAGASVPIGYNSSSGSPPLVLGKIDLDRLGGMTWLVNGQTAQDIGSINTVITAKAALQSDLVGINISTTLGTSALTGVVEVAWRE